MSISTLGFPIPYRHPFSTLDLHNRMYNMYLHSQIHTPSTVHLGCTITLSLSLDGPWVVPLVLPLSHYPSCPCVPGYDLPLVLTLSHTTLRPFHVYHSTQGCTMCTQPHTLSYHVYSHSHVHTTLGPVHVYPRMALGFTTCTHTHTHTTLRPVHVYHSTQLGCTMCTQPLT